MPLSIRTSFLIGSMFIILGVATWAYVHYTMVTLESLLNRSSTLEERWSLSGSLEWWKISQTTILNPLSAVLIFTGIMFIVFWLVQIALPITIERRRE